MTDNKISSPAALRAAELAKVNRAVVAHSNAPVEPEAGVPELRKYLAEIAARDKEAREICDAIGMSAAVERPEYTSEIHAMVAYILARWVASGHVTVPDKIKTEIKRSAESSGIDPGLVEHPAVQDLLSRGLGRVLLEDDFLDNQDESSRTGSPLG